MSIRARNGVGTTDADAGDVLSSFRPPNTGVLVALGVVAVFACKGEDTKDDEEDDNQFREDVIQCEEAVARLEKCCPDFDGSRVLCNYYYSFDTGICQPTTTQSIQPALNLSESQCVRDTSCDDLVVKNVCRRAQDAKTYTSRVVSDNGDASTTDRQTHPPVCP